jgi:large subunit ribosomal protein L22
LANATQNPNIDDKILYVKEIFVDPGPAMKRQKAKTMGRSAAIKRRMSHITVVLDEQ